MSENLVEVKHLQQYFPAGGVGKNKRYVQAVDDVSFAIRKGETLGLVGESGCGKTTTGRTLLRLYEPAPVGGASFPRCAAPREPDGTIIYDGKVLFDKKEKIAVDMLPYRRRMQIVCSRTPYASLDPRMTIGDIVGEGIDIHHLCDNAKDRHDKIISLLERVGLNSEHANRYPHEFSGGQRQRRHRPRPGWCCRGYGRLHGCFSGAALQAPLPPMPAALHPLRLRPAKPLSSSSATSLSPPWTFHLRDGLKWSDGSDRC